MVTAAALAGTVAPVAVPSASASAGVAMEPAASAVPDGPLSAADEASAMALAYRTRKPVAVTGLTSETALTWALPDGTFKSELHVGPERTRDEAGAWVAVDPMLERKSDGSVAPKAHPRGLWLSGARGAGSDDLVTLGRGDERATLGWRGALPEPVLDGTKATYPEVKPGVDLVIDAGRTGFQ
ncbi:hypothetical protein ACFQ4H_14180 [Micromonospora sonneratiae]|uniref:L,D-transpeptidase catalytic domain n=1 Tax=Micromonospora sonneratiae TaxID=1184706 RepID=A0ABW3YF67_9ACTN